MGNHGQTVFYLEGLQLDWLPKRQRTTIQRCNGPFLGLVTGMVGGLIFGLVGGLIFGLVGGLIFGLGFGLGYELPPDNRIYTSFKNESGDQGIQPPLVSLALGLVAGLVGGLIVGLVGGLIVGLVAGLIVGLVGGLRFGVAYGIVGLVGGLRFGVAYGLVSGLCLGLVWGWYLGLMNELGVGGAAYLYYHNYRLWLIRNGSTPWNYVRFLDHAAERILLRKVGGGYAFIHRMLLEYFAARYVEPSSGDRLPAKPSSTQDELQPA
jgi:hypothetical protein